MMTLCCCPFMRKKMMRDTSTQTDSVPLIEPDKRKSLLENEAKCRSSLETALRLVQQAVNEDRARHYEEALSLYQHALVYFLESLNYEAESESIKEKILSKCKQYLDRAEKLAEYLHNHNEARRSKTASLSHVSTSVAMLTEQECAEEPETNAPRNAVTRMYHSIIKRNRETRSSTSSSNGGKNNNNNNFDFTRSYSTTR